jgi:signal transduction histidine kinase
MTRYRFWILGLVVLALAAILNLGALKVAERGSSSCVIRRLVRQTQRVQILIEHLLRLAVDAETGQRGYLLTGRDSHLQRYVDARNEIPAVLKELRELTPDNPVQATQLVTVGTVLFDRLATLERGIALKRDQDSDGLAAYMQQRSGKIAMDTLRLALDGMAAEEKMLHERRFEVFAQDLDLIRKGFLLVVGLNLFLVSVGAIFVSQDLRRHRREAIEAKQRAAQLAQTVLQRTAELTELSHYLQRIQEDERARLAREIHDELGGTLAAAKIDLQMLSNKLAPDNAQQTRIVRAMTAIDDAVQVKRRIIEDLRPSVLDNLGIAAALKWQCAEYTKRSGVPCRVELHDDALVLSPAYSITFYRIVQEALTNIGKHADAKNVAVSLQRECDHWILRIADDGIGIDPAKPQNPLGHGLLSMRERARATRCRFYSRQAGHGTIVEIKVAAEAAPA